MAGCLLCTSRIAAQSGIHGHCDSYAGDRNWGQFVQVALALVLLVAAGLMIRSFRAMLSVQPGFTHPERIQTVRISIPEAQVPEAELVIRMQNNIFL